MARCIKTAIENAGVEPEEAGCWTCNAEFAEFGFQNDTSHTETVSICCRFVRLAI